MCHDNLIHCEIMKKGFTIGVSLLLLLPILTIVSPPSKANTAQYTGEIILVLVIGKYTTAQRQFHYPFISIDIRCNDGDVLIAGLVWYHPPGYATPIPDFTFDHTRTDLEISKFFGICRLHHIIGIGM